MLFGDWGTSRLYVLGLAFRHTPGTRRSGSCWRCRCCWSPSAGRTQVICRLYPDGGGVYSSARAAIADAGGDRRAAAVRRLRRDGVALGARCVPLPRICPMPHLWAAGSILVIGVRQLLRTDQGGHARAGRRPADDRAAASSSPWQRVPSLARMPRIDARVGHLGDWWAQFTAIILAISGVEAVANMTGIMVEPVEKTARQAIWPVLIEIVILNLVLTLAMLGHAARRARRTASPDQQPTTLTATTCCTMLAEYYVGPDVRGASRRSSSRCCCCRRSTRRSRTW